MKVVETDLPGCLLLEPQVFGDERGFFYESFNHDKLAAHGLAPRFVQDNVSRSARGVLRGLHYQWPKPQGKLVSVLEGEVWDVAVDIRRGSPSFGQWTAAVLSAGKQAPLLDSGRLRPRLRPVLSERAVHLPVHGDLRPRGRRRRALERRAARDRLAGGGTAAVGEGRERAVPRRDRARTPADVRGVKLLLLGANGQVGFELRRSLAPLGALVAATREGRLPEGAACEIADFDDAGSLAALVERIAPDVVVNAAAWTAVDLAEREREARSASTPMRRAPCRSLRARRGARLVHYSTDYVFDGRGTRPYRGTIRFRRSAPMAKASSPAREAIPRQRRRPRHPAHGLGVCAARQEFPAHHAAPRRRARSPARGRRPGRHADQRGP